MKSLSDLLAERGKFGVASAEWQKQGHHRDMTKLQEQERMTQNLVISQRPNTVS